MQSFERVVLAVQKMLGATAVIFKRDFSHLDNEGSVVQYKIGGYWTSLKKEDIDDYASIGSTN